MPKLNMEEQVINQEAEKREILSRYKKLRKSAEPYIKEGDDKLIKRAFFTALVAHKDMRRKSGEPYIYHPIAVSQIAVDEINLGPTAIAAALLHDVVEDTEITLEEIKRDFGERVAKIVDGVTKIPSTKDIELNLGVSQQVENFKKMILTLSDDVRVVMVKLADRLHNMRTLGSMPERKQLKIAAETKFIYAPLAHRLGLYAIKSELEDYYLKYTNRPIYSDIAEKLEKTKRERNLFVEKFIDPIQEKLRKEGFEARVFGRPKSIFSIYNKMQKQKVEFEQIYDLFAIRIILDNSKDEKYDCWKVYSMITDIYKPNIDRLRDWISNPRANGYESLHTTVMSDEGTWVEVQIRTKRMDEIAEKGYAAHWKYKEQGKNPKKGKYTNSGLDEWLKNIREMRETTETVSALEFVDNFQANFFNEEVYVFTPRGELKKLPNGATALDFAFEVHSEVGMQCLGAKINQKLVPLDYQLKNGDQIEIITSRKQNPSADWLRFVVTSKAKSRIREYIRRSRKEVIVKGKKIAQKIYEDIGLEYDDITNNQVRSFLSFNTLSDFFYDVGQGYTSEKQFRQFNNWKKKKQEESKKVKEQKKEEKNDELVIDENSAFEYTLAKCCTPIPGDNIFGFNTISNGFTIHRTNCPNAIELMSKYGYRIKRARWTSKTDLHFEVTLSIEGTDRKAMVRDVAQIISVEMNVDISDFHLGLTEQNIFGGYITLYLRNKNQLQELIDRLKQIEGIVSVRRNDEKDLESMM